MIIHTDKQSREYAIHGPNQPMCMAGKRGTTFVEWRFAVTIHIKKWSDRYIVHGPKQPMCTARKKMHNIFRCCFTARTIHTDKQSDGYIVHVPNWSAVTWIHHPWNNKANAYGRKKRHNICWLLLHSNDKSTPTSSHMDTWSMDLTGQYVWREKDAQHLLNTASQQCQSTTKSGPMDTSSMDQTGQCVGVKKRHNICWTLIQTMTIHTDKQAHEYIVHGPNQLIRMAEKRGTTIVVHFFTQWQSTPISIYVNKSSMHLNQPMRMAKKINATFIACCFTAMTIHTDKQSQ